MSRFLASLKTGVKWEKWFLGLLAFLPMLPHLVAWAAPPGATGAAPGGAPAPKPSPFDKLLPELGAIAILILVILLVVFRLPKIEVGHSAAFRRRRLMNWLPLGLTYAYLYMARYNLNTLAKMNLIEPTDFSTINMVGAITYGIAFIINGPLTDRFGGKRTMLAGAIGAAIANMVMGIAVSSGDSPKSLTGLFMAMTAVNMYFQSFGAVAIVKVNAPWFHVRERGTFGAIFGILISLGLYFAFDWSSIIAESFPGLEWVFYVPAIVLIVFAVLDIIFVRDTPSQAGFSDFDTADATAVDDPKKVVDRKETLGEALGAVGVVFQKLLSNPIILTIAFVEFCSGFLRQSLLQYYRVFMGSIGETDFVLEHWGMMSCCAGILGGILAGVISDHVFDSRRGPVSAVLYGVLTLGSILAVFLYVFPPALGILILFMSMAVIGVHGMLSGTASMDFGGRKNTGVAVGIIDGFVYLGYGLMALIYSFALPEGAAKKVPENWLVWPISMVPVAIVGLFLARRLWNAKPTRGGGGH